MPIFKQILDKHIQSYIEATTPDHESDFHEANKIISTYCLLDERESIFNDRNFLMFHWFINLFATTSSEDKIKNFVDYLPMLDIVLPSTSDLFTTYIWSKLAAEENVDNFLLIMIDLIVCCKENTEKSADFYHHLHAIQDFMGTLTQFTEDGMKD